MSVLLLEYASVIWSPYHQSNIHSVEMIQRRAARFMLSTMIAMSG